MAYSRVVGVLALAFCLVACLSASATAEKNEDKKAKLPLEAAINSIKDVCGKAKSYINNAKGVLRKVELFDGNAANAQSETAEAATQAESAAKENEEAKAIVANIKNISDTVKMLHLNATEELTTTVSSLKDLLLEAEKLKSECDTELPLIEKSPNEYIDTSQNALNIKNNAGKWDTHFTSASKITGVVDSTEEKTKQSLINAQVEKLHVSVIVSVAEIKTVMGDADRIIHETENKRDKVSGAIEDMKILSTTSLSESNAIIKALFQSANDALTNATGAVDTASKARQTMDQQNVLADDALANVKKTIKVNNAEQDVDTVQQALNTAQECVDQVKKIFPQLHSALQTAENSVTNANVSKQKLVTALSTTTSKPSTEPITATVVSDLLVGIGKGPDKKDATIQPTNKDTLDQSDNSAEKPKDTLSKSAQNVPTTALTGGKSPAPGAKNDSAMTVSVPLLVALIASAVLQ